MSKDIIRSNSWATIALAVLGCAFGATGDYQTLVICATAAIVLNTTLLALSRIMGRVDLLHARLTIHQCEAALAEHVAEDAR